MVFMGMCMWVIGLLRTNVYVFFREYYGIRLLYAWHPVARSHNCRIKGLFPPCSSVPLVPLRQTLRGHLPSIWTEPAHTSLPDCSRATEVTDMKVRASQQTSTNHTRTMALHERKYACGCNLRGTEAPVHKTSVHGAVLLDSSLPGQTARLAEVLNQQQKMHPHHG